MTDLPRFHDAHCHARGKADQCLVIALEGTPFFEGTVENEEIRKQHDPSNGVIAVPYVRADTETEGDAIKYHPRREGYDPEWVSADIARFARHGSC